MNTLFYYYYYHNCALQGKRALTWGLDLELSAQTHRCTIVRIVMHSSTISDQTDIANQIWYGTKHLLSAMV